MTPYGLVFASASSLHGCDSSLRKSIPRMCIAGVSFDPFLALWWVILINLRLFNRLIRSREAERCDRMKSEDISSSETRGKPYQRRVLLCDSSHPIVPHPRERGRRM